jgi:hypothetical integral membrane protein (TIGR02206 family)
MTGVPQAVAETFVLFGVAHWFVFAAIGGTTAFLSWLLRRVAWRGDDRLWRPAICWSLAAILVVGAAVAEFQRVAEGTWSLQESLPLHLCDIAIFVTAAALIGAGLNAGPRTIWHRLYELSWVWALGGTSQAVLTPDLSVNFPNAECVRYFLLHGTIVVSALVMTFGLRMRPQPGTPLRVWLVTLALAVVIMLVNWATGANYMYLRGPPAHPSLFDYFGPWPWSLLSLAVAGTVLILACYAPFWLLDRLRCRAAGGRASRRAAARQEPRPPGAVQHP